MSLIARQLAGQGVHPGREWLSYTSSRPAYVPVRRMVLRHGTMKASEQSSTINELQYENQCPLNNSGPPGLATVVSLLLSNLSVPGDLLSTCSGRAALLMFSFPPILQVHYATASEAWQINLCCFVYLRLCRFHIQLNGIFSDFWHSNSRSLHILQ